VKFFESTRGRIVVLLRRSGRTVEELARALGLTDNGVRAHLAVLERDGIARQRGSVRRGSGGGKPAYVYELTSEAEELFPKAYEPVLGRRAFVLEASPSMPSLSPSPSSRAATASSRLPALFANRSCITSIAIGRLSHMKEPGTPSGVNPCGERRRGTPENYVLTAHNLRAQLAKAPEGEKWPEVCRIPYLPSTPNFRELRHGEVRTISLPRTPVKRTVFMPPTS
jgi:DNA-binding transcriptional ArsR family regulator